MIKEINRFIPDPTYDYLFDIPTGKVNTKVVLTEADRKSGVKILCKEHYAQELYNKFVGAQKLGEIAVSKDLSVDKIYKVNLSTVKKHEMLAECTEVESRSSIYVPVSELTQEMLISDEPFGVVTTGNRNGAMYGSIKKYKNVKSETDLKQFMEDKTPFDVKIVRLVKGGFIATYEDSIECFLPGAHAAANVIYDFESYIGKTVRVIIDNFDRLSNYYIVSHKKYIKCCLPIEIHKLEFGKKYVGKLTSAPTKFGMFVEFEGIFTGLIHIAEFDNYEKESAQYKAGDEIEFYITRITTKDGKEFKINLTTSPEKINEDTKEWIGYKEKLEGKLFSYIYNKSDESLNLVEREEVIYSTSVPYDIVKSFIEESSRIQVTKVDIIDKNVSFSFIE